MGLSQGLGTDDGALAGLLAGAHGAVHAIGAGVLLAAEQEHRSGTNYPYFGLYVAAGLTPGGVRTITAIAVGLGTPTGLLWGANQFVNNDEEAGRGDAERGNVDPEDDDDTDTDTGDDTDEEEDDEEDAPAKLADEQLGRGACAACSSGFLSSKSTPI